MLYYNVNTNAVLKSELDTRGNGFYTSQDKQLPEVGGYKSKSRDYYSSYLITEFAHFFERHQ